MPHFYLPIEARKDHEFHLTGPEAFHIAKVLRRREGENLELFDGHGGRYKAVIVRICKDGSVEGRINETLMAPHAEAKVRVNLYAAMLKGQHWDWLLEKVTEIGVSCIVPVMTQHTVVMLKEDDRVSTKMDHWRKICLAAAKQCGIASLPDIRPPIRLRDALAEAEKTGRIVFAWENLKGSVAKQTIREALSLHRQTDKKTPPENGSQKFDAVNLFVGPEGGFSEEEVELAEFHKVAFVGLGPNTLRGDTAALTASALVLYELGVL